MELSIIIPIYNTPISLFKKCIGSFINYLKKNDEVIIVDDGSDDFVSNYISKLALDLNFMYIRLDKNKGVSNARNIGIHHSNNNYLIFLDADDYFFDFEKTRNEIEKINNDFDICLGPSYSILNNSLSKHLISVNNNSFIARSKDWKAIFKDYYFMFSSKFIYSKKVIINNNIFFDTTKTRGEDLLFNSLFILKSNYFYYSSNIPLQVYCYGQEGSVSNNISISQHEEEISTITTIINYCKVNNLTYVSNKYKELMFETVKSYLTKGDLFLKLEPFLKYYNVKYNCKGLHMKGRIESLFLKIFGYRLFYIFSLRFIKIKKRLYEKGN